jgi:hypothetical protein
LRGSRAHQEKSREEAHVADDAIEDELFGAAERRPITTEPAADGRMAEKIKKALLLVRILGATIADFLCKSQKIAHPHSTLSSPRSERESDLTPGEVLKLFDSTGFSGVLLCTDITVGFWACWFSYERESVCRGRCRRRRMLAAAGSERRPTTTEPATDGRKGKNP